MKESKLPGRRTLLTQLLNATLIVAMLIASLSCGGGDKTPAETTPASLLAERFEKIDLAISSEIKTFVGQDLYEHINGGAEIYHLYQFIDVSNAYYKMGETEFIADIYRFGSSDMAFGLFSTLRPPDPNAVALGAEGFRTPSSVDFVKGQFLVRITGFDETDATTEATLALAEAIEPLVPGTSEIPRMFASFPAEHVIDHSEKISATDFLGRTGLNEVYTMDYLIGESTITLLISEDEGGGKFLNWKNQLAADGSATEPPANLIFDENLALATQSGYYGLIVAGLRSGKLCGVIGYEDSHGDFVSAWLDSMP